MRKTGFAVVALAAAVIVALLAVGIQAGADARPQRYIVVYSPNATKELKAAVAAAGGQVLRANNKVGVATVSSAKPSFRTRIAASRIVQAVGRDRVIGRAPVKSRAKAAPRFSEEFLRSARKAARGLTATRRASGTYTYQHGSSRAEPLAAHQWDMRMIHATPDGSYKKERGDRKVLVGIIDTGVDGNHPDIAPNFNRTLSRNFTVDIPVDPISGEAIDGPCAAEPDGSCNDPNDVDENSHGTHVASTVGSPINGIGMAGVAPAVSLVNLRGGQDSGFFFLQPSVDALTYAGDHGIDVVNMSYFIDPWLYNCRGLAGDSSTETADQVAIIEATQRALDYAHMHGVTLVGAAGNGHTDLGLPNGVLDTQSPNFPLHTDHDRMVNNGCLDLPTEGNNVISVSSVGPSKTKADYSNYGYEEIDVAAPGGWFRDEGWPNTALAIPNQILAAYPENVAREAGDLNPDGTPNTPFVVRDCRGSTCAYYQWIQGTSMASPHATGVAALIVAKYGDRRGGGVTMHPLFTQAYLEASATDTPCMTPNPFSYANKGRVDPPAGSGLPPWTTFCEGTPVFNGVYGHGIVDALRAVTFGKHQDD